MKNWKILIVAATLPALVSGLFILGPKVHEQVTEPRDSLSYRVKALTNRAEATESRAGYSIKVVNDGDKSLSGVVATVQTKARIKKVKILEETGIAAAINAKAKPYSIRVGTLHPHEEFTIVVTLVPQVKDVSFKADVSSNEADGRILQPEGWIPRKAVILAESLQRIEKQDLVTSGMSALAVFGTLLPLLFILLLSKRKSGGSSSTTTPTKRKNAPDLLFYVAARTGLAELLSQHDIKENTAGYRKFADLVFVTAKATEGKKRSNYIATLKALLLVDHDEAKTRDLIERNIKRLEGKDFDQSATSELKSQASKLSDSLEQRDSIDQVLDMSAEPSKPALKLADKQPEAAAAAG